MQNCPKLETHELQAAIDAAYAAGGGRVCIQPGTHATGTLEIKSNVELFLCPGASLIGSGNLDEYPDFAPEGAVSFDGYTPEKSRKALIVANKADNVSITGFGVIDARGPDFYDKNIIAGTAPGAHWPKPDIPRPRLLQFVQCKNACIRDVRFKDSAGWSFWMAECENMTINAITLTGNPHLMNNDGIHLDSCRKVRISDCYIDTGDDAIVVRAIRKSLDKEYVCEDVTVSNCVLASACQCIRIGCPLDGDIRDCVFSNLTCKGLNGINFNNPLRYATFRPELMSSGASVSTDRLLFSNIAIDVSGTPITFNIAPELRLRRLGGATFSNIRLQGGKPCRLIGSQATPIADVAFFNADFDKCPQLDHTANISFDNCRVASKKFSPNGEDESAL